MCGITGIISFKQRPMHSDVEESATAMIDALSHRGPDGQQIWVNEKRNISLAHARLSIIDLHGRANQPMHYLHYTIVFNGEIYNYLEIKNQLEAKGYAFTTNSDTEVIPAAFDCWGIEKALNAFEGMFAFALLNKQTNQIYFARDRFGEKPFYYVHDSAALYFASEIKAFWVANVSREIDSTALLNFVAVGYTQNPNDKSQTFYKHVKALPPSHYLILNIDTRELVCKKWYDFHPTRNFTQQSDEANIDQFQSLFQESVALRLRSDVPIGTSLSGGLDSSAVAATIKQISNEGLFSQKAFTAVFPGFENNEEQYADKVAHALQLKHYKCTPNANRFYDYFKKVAYHQDEPFLSSSIYTQYEVYALAKANNITVLLDGQGADEILAGYKKYTHWYLQQLLKENPSRFTRELKHFKAHNFIQDKWHYKNVIASFLPNYTAKKLTEKNIDQVLQNPILNKDIIQQHLDKNSLEKPVIKHLNDLLFYNTFQFGLEELLRYADRNSMAHGVEVRLPFLSHHVVEFLMNLHEQYKMRDGYSKWLLRQSVKNCLPEEIVFRKDKVGFEPPQQHWMANPSLVDMIMHAKEIVYQHDIITADFKNKMPIFQSAHASNNFDFRILSIAATLYSQEF